MKKQNGWYVKRRYKHFDLPLPFESALALVTDPVRVATHSFYPFLAYNKNERKFKKVKLRHEQNKKIRPIRYASHHDGYIYSYYAKNLNELYEQKLQEKNLSDCVLAYRQIGGSNIDFAQDAFSEIEGRKDCAVITFDISGFFDSIDHQILKNEWCNLLNKKLLPNDHYAVYKAVIKYAYVDQGKCLEALGLAKVKRRDLPARLVKDAQEFREKVRARRIIETNKANSGIAQPIEVVKGIPQGSPISALLSNIYMLAFDEEMKKLSIEIGGYYRRYSDDILWICSTADAQVIKDRVNHAIEKMGQEVNPGKETTTYFYTDVDNKLRATDDSDRFQYLGFEFDGQRKLVRSGTISKFCRRRTYGVLSAKRKAAKASVGLILKRSLFKRKLYRKFTHLGKNNAVQYILRASKMMSSDSIRKQIKGHWSRLQKEIQKPLEK